jgi:hypothetical protein
MFELSNIRAWDVAERRVCFYDSIVDQVFHLVIEYSSAIAHSGQFVRKGKANIPPADTAPRPAVQGICDRTPSFRNSDRWF